MSSGDGTSFVHWQLAFRRLCATQLLVQTASNRTGACRQTMKSLTRRFCSGTISAHLKSLYTSGTVAKQKQSSLRRIPKARHLKRPPLSRVDVTRGEYNHIVDILNERAVILNEFRDAITDLNRVTEVQFKRIAQIQADLDVIRRALEALDITQ